MPTRLTGSGAMLTAKKMSPLPSYKKARADYGQCNMRRPCQQLRNYPVGYSSRYFATVERKGFLSLLLACQERLLICNGSKGARRVDRSSSSRNFFLNAESGGSVAAMKEKIPVVNMSNVS